MLPEGIWGPKKPRRQPRSRIKRGPLGTIELVSSEPRMNSRVALGTNVGQITTDNFNMIRQLFYLGEREFMGFHWLAPDTERAPKELTLANLTNDRSLFFDSHWYTWMYPEFYKRYQEKCKCYAIYYRVENPLFLLEQFVDFELIFDHLRLKRYKKNMHDLYVARAEKDSVFYTPHPEGRGTSQGVLLRPKDQVLDIVELSVADFNYPEWHVMKKLEAGVWSRAMAKRKK